MIYRWQTGAIAWVLHRLTGLFLTFYLTLHVWVIHNLTKGPEGFNEVMGFLGSPIFKLGEIGILFAILYHAFNGIRILIIDFGKGARYQKQLFWGLMAVASVIFLVAGSQLFMDFLAVLSKTFELSI